MEMIRSVLVVVERTGAPQHALHKACVLARHFGARIELFLCDAEHAYGLGRSYDSAGVAEARSACLADARRFLDSLRASVSADDITIDIEAVCESPLHESIVHKVMRSHPDLVIKSFGGADRGRGTFLTAADWHLIRTCPAPLMLARGRVWRPQPRFAAAVDVSSQETPQFARSIVRTADFLAHGCDGVVELLHGAQRPTPDVETKLAQLAADGHVAPDRVRLLIGDPTQTLPAFLREIRYDVLVAGALTHGRTLTALVGTLTGALIDANGSDVVLVKPSSFQCPIALPADSSRSAYTKGDAGERASV